MADRWPDSLCAATSIGDSRPVAAFSWCYKAFIVAESRRRELLILAAAGLIGCPGGNQIWRGCPAWSSRGCSVDGRCQKATKHRAPINTSIASAPSTLAYGNTSTASPMIRPIGKARNTVNATAVDTCHHAGRTIPANISCCYATSRGGAACNVLGFPLIQAAG